jgi:hypothetical protein
MHLNLVDKVAKRVAWYSSGIKRDNPDPHAMTEDKYWNIALSSPARGHFRMIAEDLLRIIGRGMIEMADDSAVPPESGTNWIIQQEREDLRAAVEQQRTRQRSSGVPWWITM